MQRLARNGGPFLCPNFPRRVVSAAPLALALQGDCGPGLFFGLPMETLLTLWALVIEQIITTGDALSQLAGRWIPCRYDGRWHRWTRDANESVSGAADWHREHGRFRWVAWVIDAVFGVFGFEDHCAMARIKDVYRAVRLIELEDAWTSTS